MVWVGRRFFSGNPLTRAISERTIAAVSTAGFACGAGSTGATADIPPCPYAASTAACSRNSAMRLSIVESFGESVAVSAHVAGGVAAPVCSLIQNRFAVLNE